MRFHTLFLLLSCSLLSFSTEQIINFNNEDSLLQIGGNVQLLEDKTNSISIEEVISSENFAPSIQEVPNLGITPSAFWIKLSIKNTTTVSALLLQIQHPIVDSIDFYYPIDSAQYSKVSLGEYQPFNQRKYKHKDYIFDLAIPQNQVKIYYLRIKSGEQIILPMVVGTHQAILESSIVESVISGMYYGLIIVMILYNLFVYFSVKDNNYLFYVSYILFVGLTQACLHGYAFKYLWPSYPVIAIQSMYWVPALVGIFALIFIKKFLYLKKWNARIIDIFNIFYVISIILSVLGQFNASQNLIQLLAMLGSFYAMYVGIYSYRKGFRAAKYFLIAWTLFLMSVIIFVLKTFDVFPHNLFTNYILLLGSSLETILLSFALADRINIFKKEKEEAQKRELNEKIEKQKILEQQAETLKVKVEEATLDLKTALNKLKETQSELVRTQKMASVGQLAAGVAHEVNNPLSIINMSLGVLEQDYRELTATIDHLLSLVNKGTKEAIIQDKNYIAIQSEIEKALDTAKRSVNRTAEITENLKTFSRVDSSGYTKTQVNKDLDTMVSLLQPTIGDITVQKDFGEVPEINCNPQSLNQCFHSVMINAIEAINKKELVAGKGLISIKTKQSDENVLIEFHDNGTGISEEIKSKIFDPFFTTKGVSGKGLGLSSVYGTINEHNGRIEIDSKEEKGTTIRFILPINKIITN